MVLYYLTMTIYICLEFMRDGNKIFDGSRDNGDRKTDDEKERSEKEGSPITLNEQTKEIEISSPKSN